MVFSTVLLCGGRTDVRTPLSLGRFSTQQTSLPVGTGSRCRRNHFIAGGNMKSKSLSCDGRQPWHAQFSRIFQREQSGSSHASLPDEDDIVSRASYAYESVSPSSL